MKRIMAQVLDPSTAPPETQGRQIRGSYLVKSIPTGADQCVFEFPPVNVSVTDCSSFRGRSRWISPDENSIRPIEEEELRQIQAGEYEAGKQVPQSWKKWRSDLLDAVEIVKDPERCVFLLAITRCRYSRLITTWRSRLKEWQSRKTDLEVRIEAEKERRKAVKQMNAAW